MRLDFRTRQKRLRNDGIVRVSVDLNGVLDQYDGWAGQNKWYEPHPEARQFLKSLYKRGYRVCVYTARPLPGVWAWLDDHDMSQYVTEVTNRKLPSIAYIDDRGLTFKGDFKETLEELLDFYAWWEDPDDTEWPGVPRI